MKTQRQEKQVAKQTAKSTQRDNRTQVGGVQEERVKGRESDGETESGTQKEVSSECADIAKLEMLA